MKMKAFINISAFAAATFIQADPIETFWIHPETKLGRCWNELWPSITDIDSDDPRIQAAWNFDAYYNETSRHDLEMYLKKFSHKDDAPINPIQVANGRVIRWVLEHKPEATYPQKTTKWPAGLEPLFMRHRELTQDTATKLWEGKDPDALGKGGFGVVYASGTYAMKTSKVQDVSEKAQNEALENGIKLLDPHQSFHMQYLELIAKYFDTFVIDGTEVGFFEKVNGMNFRTFDAPTISQQCRLLAQIAAGIAIIHEASCIDTDIKPGNVMITGTEAKLVDRGGIIDLTQGMPRNFVSTPGYIAPEREKSLASSVFSFGVTIFKKITSLGTLYERKLTQEENQFIDLLVQDCTAKNIKNRISAAQAAEILQVFSSYLEIKEAEAKTPQATADYRYILNKLSPTSGENQLLSVLRTKGKHEKKTTEKPAMDYRRNFFEAELFPMVGELPPVPRTKEEYKKKTTEEPTRNYGRDRFFPIITEAGFFPIQKKLLPTFRTRGKHEKKTTEEPTRNYRRDRFSPIITEDESFPIAERLSTGTEENHAQGSATEPTFSYENELTPFSLIPEEERLLPEAEEKHEQKTIVVECPNYEKVKAMAIEDCPKGIPIALRKMLFNPDPKARERASLAIYQLITADSSYLNTPSCGMCLFLQCGEKEQIEWSRKHPQALQQLKDRTYIFGNERTNGQDMPVSKEIYETIQGFEVETSPENKTD